MPSSACKLFNDIVLGNKTYVDLILGDVYTHQTYYMGMVDANNKVNFYDGKVRVVGPRRQGIRASTRPRITPSTSPSTSSRGPT
ncbi:MAG: hypothetical protein MZV49_25305 [Rhodopseudomonas palustris]|nr:hypothetical protein [Rhodopseudomonas palustris]